MDASDLFYRMGLRCTYLSEEETSADVRGTEFNEHKERAAVVLFCNADGAHALLPKYIRTAARPHCFQSGRYSSFLSRYIFQRNVWMHSYVFYNWLKWCYDQLRSQSSGPSLLIMHNCAGHGLDYKIFGLTMEFLPLWSTAKVQQLC